jgi:hypothetical protein
MQCRVHIDVDNDISTVENTAKAILLLQTQLKVAAPQKNSNLG